MQIQLRFGQNVKNVRNICEGNSTDNHVSLDCNKEKRTHAEVAAAPCWRERVMHVSNVDF